MGKVTYLQFLFQVLYISISKLILSYPHNLNYYRLSTRGQSSLIIVLTWAPTSLHGNRFEWCSNGLTKTTWKWRWCEGTEGKGEKGKRKEWRKE